MCRAGSHLGPKIHCLCLHQQCVLRRGRKPRRPSHPSGGAGTALGHAGKPCLGGGGRGKGRCTQGLDGAVTEVGSRQRDNPGGQLQGPQNTQDSLERGLLGHRALPL